MIKILFCCHGNICRSTDGSERIHPPRPPVRSRFLFAIDSAATSTEEIGNPPHHGTKRKLQQEQIPLIPHRARQMTHADYTYYDYLIGMDSANIRNMTRIAGGSDVEGKIYKMLSFADYEKTHRLSEARDVADPWYTGDFDQTFEDVLVGCKGLLAYIIDKEQLHK